MTVIRLLLTAFLSMQFTASTLRPPGTLLEGYWQSCREEDGGWAERVYEFRQPGRPGMELHLGPYHEYALFEGVTDDERWHDSAENLLGPDYTVTVTVGYGHGHWEVKGLVFDAVLAGGSREDCEGFWITLKWGESRP